MKQKNVQVTDEQDEFLLREKADSGDFNFSKLVRDRVDEYMEMKRRLKDE